MKTPIAVLTSDVHYSVQTLEVADQAMRMVIKHANDLEVPVIVAGDLHDTKAHIRGECVKAMIETFKTAKLQPYVLRGNHDAINEKSEEHSLEFLQDLAVIITKPQRYSVVLEKEHDLGYLIPYQHDIETLKTYLKTLPKNSKIIMHQGLSGSNSGEYIQDKSALNKEDVAGFRIISGHYHQRQTIKLPKGGTWDYIGNPYSLNFGEANDPEKGYQILYDDGSLEFVPTRLRAHKIIELLIGDASTIHSGPVTKPTDLVWVKLSAPSDILHKYTKKVIQEIAGVKQDFRLDLIPLETKATLSHKNVAKQSQPELLDSMINSLTNVDEARKTRLKSLWKELK